MTEVPIHFRGLDSPPAESAAVTPQQTAGDKIGLIHVLTRVLERRDVEGVYGTIEFAKKAGLAIVKPRDRGNAAGCLVEDVIWTSVDASIAFYTARGAYELYHPTHATVCSSTPRSLRLRGEAPFATGKSRRRWMPRVSRRSRALVQIQRAVASIAAISLSRRRPRESALSRFALRKDRVASSRRASESRRPSASRVKFRSRGNIAACTVEM